MFRVHIVQNPLRILTVPSTFHDSQQQFRRIVLQLQDQIHAGFAQGVDVVENEGRDDIQSVALVGGDAVLIVMAGTWDKKVNEYS